MEVDDDAKKFNEIKKIFMIDKVKKQNIWTPEEDDQLLKLVQTYSSKNWKEISNNFINKTSIQCYSRYKQVKPGLKKGLWTQEEDEQVKKFVEIYGHQWSFIASLMKSRNGKQIRDRYLNYINPGTKHNEFTEDEDEIIKKLYLKHGSRWSFIAQYCNGRTGDLIKNRFYSHIKKKIIIANPIIKKKFKKPTLSQALLNELQDYSPLRPEKKRSPTSKFKPDSDIDIDGLRINVEDETKKDMEANSEPEVYIVNSIPTIPSNDKCANLFDTKFIESSAIDEIIKENNSVFSSDQSNISDREQLSHSPSLYYNLANDPFDYTSSSNGSSQDFDIKSQNYFI